MLRSYPLQIFLAVLLVSEQSRAGFEHLVHMQNQYPQPTMASTKPGRMLWRKGPRLGTATHVVISRAE